MVLIEIPKLNASASITNGKWTCTNNVYIHLLDTISELRQKYYYDPDPDYTKASAIIKEFGGKITHHDEIEFDPDVVY